jgi:hypothetical protein
VQAVDTSAHRSIQFSVAEAFGGVLPPKVKIAIENQTGVALGNMADATKRTTRPSAPMWPDRRACG